MSSYDIPPHVWEAAKKIVQDAEVFDRSLLKIYVRKGELEVLPFAEDLATSNRHYAQMQKQKANGLFIPLGDLRIACRRYSTSQEYVYWLRQNPPDRSLLSGS